MQTRKRTRPRTTAAEAGRSESLLELPVASWPGQGTLDDLPAAAEEDDAPVTGYEDRYVCFIDILGFKELINASAAGNPSITPSMIFNALMIRHGSIERSFCNLAGLAGGGSLGSMMNRAGTASTGRLAQSASDLRVHSFSDCVVGSTPHTPQGLALLLYFCWQISSDWLSKQFLSRGGITSGQLIHRLSQGGAPLIFGPAFNQAYRLESELADYPRIILSRQVRLDHQAMLADAAGQRPALVEVARSLVQVFDDGPAGLDIFCHLRNKGLDTGKQVFADDAQQYQLALRKHMADACDTPHFFKKVLWLVGRFNTAILHTPYAGNHIAGVHTPQ